MNFHDKLTKYVNENCSPRYREAVYRDLHDVACGQRTGNHREVWVLYCIAGMFADHPHILAIGGK